MKRRGNRYFAARKNPAASQESYLIRCLAAWHQIICFLQPISFAPIPAKLCATAAWKPEYGRYPYCGVFSIVVSCVLFFFSFPSAWVWIMLLSPENTKAGVGHSVDAGPAGCAAAGVVGFETLVSGSRFTGRGDGADQDKIISHDLLRNRQFDARHFRCAGTA